MNSMFSNGYRKAAALLIAVLLLLFLVSFLLVAAEAGVGSAVAERERTIRAPSGQRAEPPGLWASAAILVDNESGRVLYEKNARTKLPMASTTKIMTALVARDQLDLDDQVTVSTQAASVGEQGAGLVAGETLTVEDLLWAVLVLSANDASYALAEYAAGSIQSFAALMDKEAVRLGAKDTRFVNPHGLDASGHYSTAYDLALMGRELLKDPLLAEMAGAKSRKIPGPPGAAERTLTSHNEILDRYEGADGIKTGYTSKAGWCLVASASRGNKSLVSVVLNSSRRADDTAALFNYGFDGTERVVLARRGKALGRSRVSAFPRRYVTVVPQSEMAALTFIGSGDVFKVRVVYSRQAPQGAEKGTSLGTIEAWLNDKALARDRAVTGSDSGRTNPVAGAVAFLWYAVCWMGKIISAPFRVF